MNAPKDVFKKIPTTNESSSVDFNKLFRKTTEIDHSEYVYSLIKERDNPKKYLLLKSKYNLALSKANNNYKVKAEKRKEKEKEKEKDPYSYDVNIANITNYNKLLEDDNAVTLEERYMLYNMLSKMKTNYFKKVKESSKIKLVKPKEIDLGVFDPKFIDYELNKTSKTINYDKMLPKSYDRRRLNLIQNTILNKALKAEKVSQKEVKKIYTYRHKPLKTEVSDTGLHLRTETSEDDLKRKEFLGKRKLFKLPLLDKLTVGKKGMKNLGRVARSKIFDSYLERKEFYHRDKTLKEFYGKFESDVPEENFDEKNLDYLKTLETEADLIENDD
ncbi:MAG: hypothetical protein MJ252_28240 [archaeon]|nr:hypothetical protein [archaeon]